MGSHSAATDRPLRDGGVDEIAVRLRSAGLSPTRRRRQVLEALEGRLRPVGAHELYVELAAQGDRVGMSTVYRTLSALAEAGFTDLDHTLEIFGLCADCAGERR